MDTGEHQGNSSNDPYRSLVSEEWIEDPVAGWVPMADADRDWIEPMPRRPLRQVIWAVVAAIVLLIATLVPYRHFVAHDDPPPSTVPVELVGA